MVEGFWIVQYEGLQGHGGGVVLFMKGRALGGDTGYTYIGTYQTDGKNITGDVTIHNFLPEVPNVMGIKGDFHLLLRGAVEEGIIRAAARVAGQEADEG